MESTIIVGDHFYVTRSSHFERNDIVVFNYYGNDYSAPPDEFGKFEQHWEKRVFRLIAFSGDSLEIKDGEVIVNGRYIPMPATAQTDYDISAIEQISELNELIEENRMMMLRGGDTVIYRGALTTDEVKKYRSSSLVIDMRKFFDPRQFNDTDYARTSAGKWNADNYGPVRIPEPGETILVDEINLKFFRNIPDIKMGTNTIKEKLYFVMGDNRHAAEDSRFIGLISHSNMYGIVK